MRLIWNKVGCNGDNTECSKGKHRNYKSVLAGIESVTVSGKRICLRNLGQIALFDGNDIVALRKSCKNCRRDINVCP